MYEYLFNSKKFEKCSDKEIIQICYSFYQVHAGTINFFELLEEELNNRLNDRTQTIDLLKVL